MGYIDVLDKILDSNNTTVGGGSAAAISGAMAAGLISMVARLSTGKDYGLEDEEYIVLADELDQLSLDLLKGAEDDTKAYLLIKNAFKLPKDTDEEKKIRRKAVNDAGVEAALVPKSNSEKCIRVYEIARDLDGKYNDGTFSDFTIGRDLSFLGIQGCIYNIEANLSLIKNEKIRGELEEFIRTNKEVRGV